MNIITVLEKCEKNHAGIKQIYSWLSESAHPNYEGMRLSYSSTDPEKKLTTFSNKTNNMYAKMQQDGLLMVMGIFEHEYARWQGHFEKLETWLVENEKELEQFKAPSN